MAPEDIYNCKQKPNYLLVLVHGILSSSSDWTYATTVLKSQLTNNFLIYASSCNSYTKTFDGIDRSGRRLAEEVLDVVRSTGSLRKISFLAHSLGGLFTRYAIALLCSASTFQKDLHDVDLNGNSGHSLNLGTIAGLEPINFITLATPHIGIRGKKQVNYCGLLSQRPSFFLAAGIVVAPPSWLFFHLLSLLLGLYGLTLSISSLWTKKSFLVLVHFLVLFVCFSHTGYKYLI